MVKTRICLTPKVSGVGGMVSFRHRLADALQRRGVEVGNDLDAGAYDAVLVIGGTRDLAGIWRLRKQGVRIVQRLDGMNWLHRHLRTGWRHALRAEYGNRLLNIIRTRLADSIVYQSEFARDWWQDMNGPAAGAACVIHNGVDLSEFTPDGDGKPPDDVWRILLVEGSLMGGYELGLETAVALAREMVAASQNAHSQAIRRPVELQVVGRVSPQTQARFRGSDSSFISWAGLQPVESIPQIDRSAHLLFSADLNAACPNSVIEAMGCGLPVLGFNTGALAELVQGNAGRVVPYGGDPWMLDAPDIPALARAAWEMLVHQVVYRPGARRRAEAAFNIEAMADRYLEVFLGD